MKEGWDKRPRSPNGVFGGLVFWVFVIPKVYQMNPKPGKGGDKRGCTVERASPHWGLIALEVGGDSR